MFPFIRPAPGTPRCDSIFIVADPRSGLSRDQFIPKHVADAKSGVPRIWASVGKSTKKPKEL
jgi:hypothetical protein